MSAFHDVLFPLSVGLGARGGPERFTEIVELASGAEERNTPWAHSRRRWDAGPGVRSLDDFALLTAFFEARRGRLHAFRFRDPADHASCLPSGQVNAGDQLLGLGDGTRTRFALVKRYGEGEGAYLRPIALPVAASVLVAMDGEAAGFTLDGGDIVLDEPAADGAAVTAGFQFDVPVRFDTDSLEITLDAFRAGAIVSVPLVEVRLG
ncbi:MAG: gene transfer agent TIGR02217 family protein [Oceanicaulis sp. HLUCCA04]|nr:MAG: gene transfer agent TIGR02217 family protein [Oceanicaulis sp. HLUCCA04]